METLRPEQCRGRSCRELTALIDGLTVLDRGVGRGRGHSEGSAEQGRLDVPLTGVTLDSRTVQPGDLYAALPGANVHGAMFVAAAVTAGAGAVLTDPVGWQLLREAHWESAVPVLSAADPRAVLGEIAAAIYDHPGQALQLIGITGTNGKTTTSHLLVAALESLGRRVGLIGTIETRIAGQALRSVRTTPESPDLHGLFAVMREQQVATCVMEVSSHALAQHRVDGVIFDLAVFTNLSQDHLDFHGSMENYYAAKASLFTPARARRGIVVVDDSWGQRLAAQSGIPVVTVTSHTEREADWQIEPGRHRSTMRLVGPDCQLEVKPRLPGHHNRINTALVAIVLHELGLPLDDLTAALQAPAGVPGRMEQVAIDVPTNLGPTSDPAAMGREIHPPTVYVDYAHTPDAVEAALRALRESATGPLVAVLGAGGGRDPGKREAMGRAAAAAADEVVITDDNPRREDPSAIRAALLAGARSVTPGSAGPTIIEIADRQAAIEAALASAAGHAGAVVAVLGKGHETGQDIAGVVHPFDDRLAVTKAWQQIVDSSRGGQP